MKGILCAGGMGKRLQPMTLVTNKHLLPVYDRPMIYFPIATLRQAGVTEIMVITGPENAGDFLKLLGSGKSLGVKLTYRVQDEAGGIAQAIGMCRDFVGKEKCMVVLGDNIIEDDLQSYAQDFANSKFGAKVLLKEVPDPSRFGVAEVSGDKIIGIEEKPSKPKTNYAVTGVYFYDSAVFDVIASLKPSARNELEVTDVNNAYIRKGQMTFAFLAGSWTDAGTVESLQRAAQIASEMSGKGNKG